MSGSSVRPKDLGIGELFEKVRDAVVVADPGTQRIVLWNQAATRIFGYSASEALGLPVEELVPESLKLQHREGITSYHRTGHGPYIDSDAPLDLPAVRKDGRGINVELSLSPIGPASQADGGGRYVLAIIRDITGRKRAEEARSRLAAIVESSDDAIIGKTLDGVIASWNSGAKKIYGYSADEVIGRPISILAPPDRPDEIPGFLRRVRGGEKVDHYETVRVRKDGEHIHVSLTISPVVDAAGDVVGASIIARDVTERKRAEDLRRQKDFYETLLKIQSDIGEGLIIVDGERIVYANEAFTRISGYSNEELTALPSYLDLLAPEENARMTECLCRLQDGRPGETGDRYETVILNKDGRRVHLDFATKAFLATGHAQLVAITSDITERKRAEESLRRSLRALLTLHEAGQVFGSTLMAAEVGQRLLEIARRASDLEAAVIHLRDRQRRLQPEHTIGSEDLWRSARDATEARAARRAALENGERGVFELHRRDPGDGPARAGALVVGVCLPLRVRDWGIGVLEVYGPETLREEATVELLGSLANQAASALENARLFGERAEHERQLQNLVAKLLAAQEEERRRVAYEVHDGLAQMIVAAQQHLEAFARQHTPGSDGGRKDLDWILGLVQQTVEEARRVIGGLRPTALDDFGLTTAIRLQVEALRAEGWEIRYEEALGDDRLPAALETALYRVAQEALNNVRKHAGTTRVHIKLGRLGRAIRLRVRDRGCGFATAASNGSMGPGQRVGLHGMRERVALLGGELEVCSKRGAGTLIAATVPLAEPAGSRMEGVRA